MKNEKLFFFTAFKYVVPADYEHWFEELAAAGWHPVKIGQWSSVVMRFVKTEPKKYRYVVDMQPTLKMDYKQTYEEFGWEYLGQMASAQVWRQPYSVERPESFSDAPSREARNKRFMLAVSVSLTLFLLATIALAVPAIFSDLSSSDRLQLAIAAGLFFLIAVLLSAVMNKVKRNIGR